MNQEKFDPANMTEDQKKLAEGLSKCKSEAEAKKFLEENGLKLSESVFEALSSDKELDDNTLENIAGGGWADTAIKWIQIMLKCNAYTGWGTKPGRHCICGYHGF